MRGKLSREVDRQKRVRDKRLRGHIKIQFLCLLLSSFTAPSSFSSLFLSHFSQAANNASSIFSVFPIRCILRFVHLPLHVLNYARPLWHLTTAVVSVIIAPRSPRVCSFTSRSSFSPKPLLRPRLFALDGPPNVIYRKPKSLRCEVLTPVASVLFLLPSTLRSSRFASTLFNSRLVLEE